jgi:hypothetical protein
MRVYTRPLPGGGFVAIEAHPVRTFFGSQKIRGELIVERRSEARRVGHRAPVAACAEHPRFRDIINALFPIAHSDQAIAQLLARKVMATAFAGRKLDIS